MKPSAATGSRSWTAAGWWPTARRRRSPPHSPGARCARTAPGLDGLRLQQAQPGVASVAQVGNDLRVLLDADAGSAYAAALGEALRETDPDARIEAVPASLEDVFVAATTGRERISEAA